MYIYTYTICTNTDDNLVGESGNEATNVNMSELPHR